MLSVFVCVCVCVCAMRVQLYESMRVLYSARISCVANRLDCNIGNIVLFVYCIN